VTKPWKRDGKKMQIADTPASPTSTALRDYGLNTSRLEPQEAAAAGASSSPVTSSRQQPPLTVPSEACDAVSVDGSIETIDSCVPSDDEYGEA